MTPDVGGLASRELAPTQPARGRGSLAFVGGRLSQHAVAGSAWTPVKGILGLMVLPTDYHWALRGWLRLHSIEAYELAGDLIVGDLDELLRLAGTPRRLSAPEHELVSMARSREGGVESYSDGDDVLATRVEGLLAEVCQALCDAGLQASPWHGAGALVGDEVFDALVSVDTRFGCTN